LNKLPAVVICILILLACTSHEYSVPDLQLYDVDSNLVSLHDLIDEGPVVIGIWALWCKMCIRELDALKPYYPEIDSMGIHFLAISQDPERSISLVRPFAMSHDWEYLILLDPNNITRDSFDIYAVPMCLAIDQKGDVVFTYMGYKSGDEVTIVDTLRYLFGN
jgi:cytochrome c biogenesis protein CcmG/thiol:disulfide interchange protein DsbE